MTRTVHTGTQTADVSTTGPIDGTELEKRSHRRVALRTTDEDGSVTTDPEITLETSVDGETWVPADSATGTELELTKAIPDPYVRANVTGAGDSSLTLWISAL